MGLPDDCIVVQLRVVPAYEQRYPIKDGARSIVSHSGLITVLPDSCPPRTSLQADLHNRASPHPKTSHTPLSFFIISAHPLIVAPLHLLLPNRMLQ